MVDNADLDLIAIHEAGHVAVAFSKGVELRKRGVTVPRADEQRTGCSVSSHKKSQRPSQSQLEKHALILCGGISAEIKFSGWQQPPERWKGQDDFRQISEICLELSSTERESRIRFDLYMTQAQDILEQPNVWGFVRELATALLEEGTQSSPEVQKLWWHHHSGQTKQGRSATPKHSAGR